MTHPLPRRSRLGFTTTELIMVVVIMAVTFAMVIPRMTTIKNSSELRAGRQQLTAAFAAARSAALQKGKTATLTITGSVINVSVLSGISFTSTSVLGPIRLDKSLGLTLSAIGSSPTTLVYNARGLLNPTPAAVLKYQISNGTTADTLCISTAGLILPKGCTL
jgi:type II secretory pathway pseudopilin PulG